MTGTIFRLLLASTALIASVWGACPSNVKSADDCLQKDAFSKLSQGDPSYYCEQGAVLSAAAQNCLKACSYSEQDSFLVAQKKKINDFCITFDSNCASVTDTYVNQTRCYEDYGGIDSVINKIVSDFEAKSTLNCNPLYWGRYCQRTQTCSYNLNLDQNLIKENRVIALGLALCGSETLKEILPFLGVSEGCSEDMYSTIEKKCNISSCNHVDTTDKSVVCSLFEGQAKCFQQETAKCTAAERRYVLPRLNSYAVANRYLGCAIKYNGVTVRPTGADRQYSSLINQCLFTDTLDNALTLERLQPLYNRDTYVEKFCQTKLSSKDEITNCRNAFLAVATPQSKLLIRAQDQLGDLTANFAPDMVPFPVDSFGMAYFYNSLPDNCAGIKWSNRVCVPASEIPVEQSTSTTSTASTTSTTEAAIRDPGQGSVPDKVNNEGQNYEKNSSGALMPALMLLLFSALSALL